MNKAYGAFLVFVGLLLLAWGLLHSMGQFVGFSGHYADPDYSRVLLFGKMIVPVLFFLLAYVAGKRGVSMLRG